MSRIYVEFAQLHQLEAECRELSGDLSQIRFDFRNTVRQLDWDVRFQNDINYTADRLAEKLEAEENALKAYEQFLLEAYNEYQKLDQEETDPALLNVESLASTGTSSNTSSNVPAEDNQFSELLKTLLRWADKTDQDPNAGILNDGWSYLDALVRFLTGDKKGLSGAEDWCNLGDKSVGLWTGLYDYLKKYYNGAGNTFSLSNQEKVAGLGIAGGVIGLIGHLCGAADTIGSTANMGAAGIAGEVLGAGGDAIDIWSGAERLKHVGDTAANITTSEGVYSPLSLYTAIGKGYVSAFAQGFSSYEEYSADGEYDLNDVAATGMDFAVTGLYSMVDTLTFGLISEETTGVSAKDVSKAIYDFAADTGIRAGNYIVDHPELHESYNNTNVVGQVFITAYASIASLF